MRLILAVAAVSLLQGCCCCPFGGGGGGGGSSGTSSPLEEWAAEEFAEKMVEGAAGEDVDLEFERDKGFTLTTDEGEMTTFADGSMPDGFPLPLPDDAKVQSATRLVPSDGTDATWTVMVVTGESPKEVLAWYTEQAESAGYTVTTMDQLVTMASGGAEAGELPISDKGMLTLQKGEAYAGSIYAVPGDEGTEVMIILGPSE